MRPHVLGPMAALLIPVATALFIIWLRRSRARIATVFDAAALCKLVPCKMTTGAMAAEMQRLESEGMQRLVVLPGLHGMRSAASILIEPKCLRGGASAAHICGLLPSCDAESDRASLLEELIELARCEGCYKAIINARPADASLLLSCGFVRKQLTMVADVSDTISSSASNSKAVRLISSASSGAEAGLLSCGAIALGESGSALAGYTLRPLEVADGAADYIALLSQLSHAPPLKAEVFAAQMARIHSARGLHAIFVVADPTGAASAVDGSVRPRPAGEDVPRGGRLVACATILFEREALV